MTNSQGQGVSLLPGLRNFQAENTGSQEVIIAVFDDEADW